MKKAIVTGANGFIGEAVCRALTAHGIEVWALVRDPERMKLINSNVHAVKFDMNLCSDAEGLLPRDADVFYHLAWEGASGKILTDYHTQFKNVIFTCNALSLAANIDCKKFIMAGTINELELFQLMDAQNTPPRPACIYGISKLCCDFACKTLAVERDIEFNCAVIGSCFGPRDMSKRIHNTFIHGMLTDVCPKLVCADNLHDWIYVDDVAEMFVAIGMRSVNLKNYYLGHNKLRVFKDILTEVRDILSPSTKLRFGEVPGKFFIDYSLVDINAVYEDTDYSCNSDFAECIWKTAEHVKNMEW